jgi:hypothetical protein
MHAYLGALEIKVVEQGLGIQPSLENLASTLLDGADESDRLGLELGRIEIE